MQQKGRTGTAAVTAEEIRGALNRTQMLSTEEEKIVRMRYGGRQENLRAPLPRAAQGNVEVADELLLLEMQLMKAYRMRPAQNTRATAEVSSDSPSKDKIIRALRRKK